MKQHKGMRPHDIAVLLKIAITEGTWMSKDLSDALKISQAEISYSLNRSATAGLIDHTKRKVMRNALLEFIRYGLPYIFPPEKGPMAKGVPTAFSAPVMSSQIVGSGIVVWPHMQGNARGESISPLYPNAVDVALQDEQMYDLLALIDVMRIGKVREKEIAIKQLKNLIGNKIHA
ncbi:hypothetical protein [Parapedobacter tibetensis]|uniref:hypothetical protein n=1 Tax=Parapedobacter tibetensis TaxID=2972951 RepID=UPI00214D1BA4|nr:hypothetical protein [Parapedobacter tibetensis]